MTTDENYNIDIDRTFDRIAVMMHTRIGKIITLGIVAVVGVYLSGHLMHLLAGAVIGYKTLSAAIRKPI